MKRTIRLAIAVLVALSATGCTAFIGLSRSMTPMQPAQSLSPISANNETIEIKSGTYRGPLRVDGNNVTVRGAGVGRTVITGGAVIDGNNIRIENLSVEGPVTVIGNNNDLRSAELRSNDIKSDGNNIKL